MSSDNFGMSLAPDFVQMRLRSKCIVIPGSLNVYNTPFVEKNKIIWIPKVYLRKKYKKLKKKEKKNQVYDLSNTNPDIFELE